MAEEHNKQSMRVAINHELPDTFVEGVGPTSFDGAVFKLELLAYRLEPKSSTEADRIGWPVARLALPLPVAQELQAKLQAMLKEAADMRNRQPGWSNLS
jgi:hypothetical protein